MAFTQLMVDTLKAAIASGAKQVNYGDKMVQYRNMDEMVRTLALMQADLITPPSSGRKYAQQSKGLNPPYHECY